MTQGCSHKGEWSHVYYAHSDVTIPCAIKLGWAPTEEPGSSLKEKGWSVQQHHWCSHHGNVTELGSGHLWKEHQHIWCPRISLLCSLHSPSHHNYTQHANRNTGSHARVPVNSGYWLCSVRPCSDTVVPTLAQTSMKQVRYLFLLAIVVICCHQLYINDGHNPSLILWLVSFYSENFSLLPSDCEILCDWQVVRSWD